MGQKREQLDSGRYANGVLSSRVRLARNLAGMRFPCRMTPGEFEEVQTRIEKAITDPEFIRQGGALEFSRLETLAPDRRTLLMEEHRISPKLFALPGHRALATGLDNRISLMVNEEDHVRIQGFAEGFDLSGAYVIAAKMDEALEARLPFAFDEKKGYLTSCPSNLGTGLRASLMLFLPALSLRGQIAPLAGELARQGCALRGYYGEGTRSQGFVYQLSNQVTLGLSEEEIRMLLENRAEEVLGRELSAIGDWESAEEARVRDEIQKAFGLVRYARMLSLEEATRAVALLRLGRMLDTGLPIAGEMADFNRILVEMQPAHLGEAAGRSLEKDEREEQRAGLVRRRLLEE